MLLFEVEYSTEYSDVNKCNRVIEINKMSTSSGSLELSNFNCFVLFLHSMHPNVLCTSLEVA